MEPCGRNLAVLPTKSIENVNQLLVLGAHDLRVSSLPPEMGPMFSAIGELMARQEKKYPALWIPRASVAKRPDQSRHEQLDHFAIPDTLGHLDLNPGNIVVNDSRATFLDWAKRMSVLPHSAFHLSWNISAAYRRDSLNEKYLQPSMRTPAGLPQDPEDFRNLNALFAFCCFRVCNQLPRLARYGFSFGDAHASGFFHGLTRRMYRKATLLEGGREICSN